MRRTIALLAAIGGGVSISWVAASRMLSGATLVTRWPSPVFAQQFPDRHENDAATRLLATAERFGDDLRAARPALRDSLRNGASANGAATAAGTAPNSAGDESRLKPALDFLARHANTIRTLRAQIVSNDPPAWRMQIDDVFEPPVPPLPIHMELFSVFGADALAQHANKNDAAAWADLHAVWILSRSLWQRPEWMSIATALMGSRIIASVAPKIGPPVPAWWSEFASLDVRAPLLRSIEYEAWATRVRAERYPLGEPDGSKFDDTVRKLAAPFVRPIRVAQSEIAAGRLKHVADAAAHAAPCRAIVIPGAPEWAAFVNRFNQFRCASAEIDNRNSIK